MTVDVSLEWGHTGCNQIISCKQFGDFFSSGERCSFFILPQKLPTVVKHFWFFILMTDHVSFEWAFTSYKQVFSCKQFGDFFLDRWEIFVLHPSKKPRQLSSTFTFIDWWLLMSHLDEVIQAATWPWAVSNLMIIWLLSSDAHQAVKIFHKCFTWISQCCLCQRRYCPCWVFMPMPRQRIGWVSPTGW